MRVLLAALLAATCWCGCSRRESPVELAIPVRTSQLKMRVFQESVRTQGVVEAAVHATISAVVPGQLEKFQREENEAVKAGELLFQSDRKNLENACRLADDAYRIATERNRTRQADVELARANLVKAESDYQRNLKLHGQQAISTSSFESFLLAYQRAKLALTQAEAAVSTTEAEMTLAGTAQEIARKKLSDSQVTAPFSGIITAKLRQENEFCAAGTPVLKLEDPNSRRVCVVLSSIHYPQVKVGATQVEIRRSGKIVATVPVTRCSATIDPLSRTFEVKADLPAGIEVTSGELCEVKVIFAQRNSPALPEGALRFAADGKFTVFAVDAGRAHAVDVRAGVFADGFAEIIDGAELAGKEIIVSGQYFVNDGSAVKVLTE